MSADNKEKKVILIIIAAVLAYAALACGIAVIVFNKFGFVTPKKAETIRTSYVNYLGDEIVPEYGLFDKDDPKSHDTGIMTASQVNLGDTKAKELVVTGVEGVDNNHAFNFYCYKYDDDKVKECSVETAFDDYVDDFFDNGTVVYSVTNDEKEQYVICEHYSIYEDYSYVVTVFGYDDDKFEILGQIKDESTGSDSAGGRIVYCPVLPNDLDYYKNYADISKKSGLDIGAIIDKGNLMYLDGATPPLDMLSDDFLPFSYDDYYKNDLDSIVEFLKLFGVDKTEQQKKAGSDYSIYDMLEFAESNYADKETTEMILKFVYENVDNEGKYTIKDYSELDDLLDDYDGGVEKEATTEGENKEEEGSSLTPSKNDFNDFEKMLNESYVNWRDYDCEKDTAGDVLESYFFEEYCAYYSYYWDCVTVSDQDENAHKDPLNKFVYDYGYYYELDADKADFMIEKMFNNKPDRNFSNDNIYYYKDKLYVNDMQAGMLENTYEIVDYVDLGDGKYGITTKVYLLEETAEGFQDVCYFVAELKHDERIGKYWSFYEISVNKKCFDSKTTNTDILGAYTQELYNRQIEYGEKYVPDMMQYHLKYSIYDINNDGVKDFIIQTGDSEATSIYYIYTYDNGLVNCGNVSGFHAGFYIPESGSGLMLITHFPPSDEGAFESLSKVNLINNKVVEKVIYNDKLIADDSEYAHKKYEYLDLIDYDDRAPLYRAFS